MIRPRALLSLMVLLAGAWPTLAQSHAPQIGRAGLAEQRVALDALELKPFPFSALSKLTNLTGGGLTAAPTAESIKGKVLVLATFTAWHPASQQAMVRAGKIIDAKGAEVVGLLLHRAERFDSAAKFVTDKGLRLTLAQDPGTVREALKAESDPVFYVVDRAGNLRFAAVELGALDAALTLVLGETAEAAAAVPATVAASKTTKTDTVSTRSVGENARPGSAPKVQYLPPPPQAYARAVWPRLKADEDPNSAGTGEETRAGQLFPTLGTLGNTGVWLSPKPASLDGKIVVVYFFSPLDATARAMPALDDVHRTNAEDVVVMAISGPAKGNEANKADQVSVERYLREHRHAFSVLWEPGNDSALALGQIKPGLAYVVSTDGIIRWSGSPNDRNFRRAINGVTSVDPGVLARRAAEAAASGK